MTDRELLEWAAKAAGLKLDTSRANGGPSQNDGFDLLGNAVLDWHNGTKWNPLVDDGDALRLAVRLRLDLRATKYEAWARPPDDPVRVVSGWVEPNADDPYAAARRAIVNAAAEIGRRID